MRPASGCCPACSTSTPTTTSRCSVGPSLSESLRHGVTTVMLGSCSLSTVHVGRRGRRRHLRPRRGHPPRTRHRRRRRAQDLDELQRSTSQALEALTAWAPTSRRSSATPTCAPRRWAWIAPRRKERTTDQEPSRPRWSGCSPRRCGPASSECPRSNCFSTSSTATSAGRARCRRRMPSRANCAG